jgi:signal transduction histidine kinase
MATRQSGPERRPTRRRDTLQARLVASHMLVLLLALGFVTLSSALYVRRYERTAEEDRIAQLAVPLIAEVNVARVASGSTKIGAQLKDAAIDAQADALGVRILILDPDGTVRYDTSQDESLQKTTLPEYAPFAADVVSRAQRTSGLQYVIFDPTGTSAFAGKRVLIGAAQTGILKSRRALVLVTDVHRFPLIRLVLPRLLIVTGLSLVLASVLGFVFSRRIARPVRRLTAAADAMAAGNLEQQVEPERDDEIGRLVESFNTMSHQVASTYQSQRQLLSDVAHELRTPLTSVQGYAQALQDGVVDEGEERARVLRTIGRESERMSSLIAQLLDLARLESGQAKIAIAPVDADGLLQRALERFRGMAQAKGVVISARAGEGLAIAGDEGRLLQILSNLIANAVRHTPSGGLVSLTAERDEKAVRLVVHDTGEGIPPERLPAIFNRFERGEMRDGDAGFGLGLAIVRELVTLHHGTIDVASQVGRGTTFTIGLPAG